MNKKKTIIERGNRAVDRLIDKWVKETVKDYATWDKHEIVRVRPHKDGLLPFEAKLCVQYNHDREPVSASLTLDVPVQIIAKGAFVSIRKGYHRINPDFSLAFPRLVVDPTGYAKLPSKVGSIPMKQRKRR